MMNLGCKLRMAGVSLFALSIPLVLTGCESIFGPDDGAPPPLTELPRQLSVGEQQVIRGSNQFAFGLLREASARVESANVFLSPLSVSMALGMTMNGARAETFDEMRSTLGFAGLEQDEINASYRSLIDLLLGLDESVEMRIANALWVRQGFPLHDPFVAAVNEYFDAEARELDFTDPASLAIVNGWVNASTNGRIPEMLDELDPDMVLYLMNAIYFKGSWTQQFDRGLTQEAPFFREDGTEQRVQMMSQKDAEVGLFQDAEVQILDLPYSREAFSMTLVLPAQGSSLDDLVASMDEARWSDWIGRLRETKATVEIPRFRLEYEQMLNETLQALGMEQAFDEGAANLTGISPAREDLFIDEVLQKTFLEVNEEGTEAAAATSVGVMPTSAPPTFRVDRPFLAVIRERLSGTILFIGTIGSPVSQ